MRLGVCIFGFFAARPTSADEFIRLAEQFQLQSVEIDATLLMPKPQRVRELLERNGMSCVVASGQLLQADIESLLTLAHQLNAKAVRVILSSVLEGDRQKVDGGDWQAHLRRCAERLRQLASTLERFGIPLALENHQDAMAEELVWLCEQSGTSLIGVCFDTGNPLAVLQDPIEFAKIVAPFVRDVHLKDYRLLRAPQGFYLQRCPLGKGVVDFEAVLRTLANQAPQDLTLHIELGALQKRHIRWHDPSWWASFPPSHRSDATTLLERIECLIEDGGEDASQPHDATKREQELKEFAESVAFMRSVLALIGQGG
jgi:sugar phosphate isomerase/epimerase